MAQSGGFILGSCSQGKGLVALGMEAGGRQGLRAAPTRLKQAVSKGHAGPLPSVPACPGLYKGAIQYFRYEVW